MGAAALSSPELVLDDAEAKTLAEGIAAVQEHYNYTASAETIAWANLVAAMVAVYGPRVYLIHDRKKKERRSKKAPQPQSAASEFDNVYQSIVNPGNM